MKKLSSRDRMRAAIKGEKVDYVPLSFMIFNAVRSPRDDWFSRIEAQIKLGLDPVASLMDLAPEGNAIHPDAPGLPISIPADVTTRQWKETPKGARYPVLYKEYDTPAGKLSTAVDQTDDWPHADDVPLFSDYVGPRCHKYLVEGEADLPAFCRLLRDPLADEIRVCRERWQVGAKFARDNDLLLTTGWGIGADALGWLTGLDKAVLLAIDEPDFLDTLLDIIFAWNRKRMELMLEPGVDLFIRRAWYEGTSYWSPTLFERFLMPRLAREVELAHQAGAAYAYIMTAGSLQFAPLLRRSGIDVLIGIDPVQDKDMDMTALRPALGDDVSVWGGINAFVTVERGTTRQIKAAVGQALEALGKTGTILSPVDNIRDPSDKVWKNVLALIKAWKQLR